METGHAREDERHPEPPVGVVYGNVSSSSFRCILSDPSIKEMDHVEVHHPVEGWILGKVDDLELRSDVDAGDAALLLSGRERSSDYRRIATIKVIGRRNEEGRLIRPLTPVLPSSSVYLPDEEPVREVLGLGLSRENGAYVGKLFNTGMDVCIDPYQAVGNHVSIIAKTGSGKSYVCGVLVEELNRHGIPVVILDLHGEYRSLMSPNIDEDEFRRMSRFGVSPRGLADSVSIFSFSAETPGSGIDVRLGLDVASMNAEDLLDLMGLRNVGPGSSVLYSAIRKVKDILGDDVELYDIISAVEADANPAKWNVLSGLEHIQRIDAFNAPPTPVTQIVSKGRITIVEMKDAPLDTQQIGAAVLLKKLFHARKEGLIPPFMLVVEEAHHFCPQSGPAITSPILRSIASEGRKFGMGLLIVSQRPAKVDKNVLSQCGTQIILKLTNPNDIKAVIASVEGLTTRMVDEIQRLPVGVAILVGGGISEPILVEVRTRMTRHGGGGVDILRDLEMRG